MPIVDLSLDGKVAVVTGAAGGVGSVATAILNDLGYDVAAVTGRPETEGYLRDLGASRIVAREELAETVKRPLESESWVGCVDAVGGPMLARVLGQMCYGASVAAVGLAGRAKRSSGEGSCRSSRWASRSRPSSAWRSGPSSSRRWPPESSRSRMALHTRWSSISVR